MDERGKRGAECERDVEGERGSFTQGDRKEREREKDSVGMKEWREKVTVFRQESET